MLPAVLAGLLGALIGEPLANPALPVATATAARTATAADPAAGPDPATLDAAADPALDAPPLSDEDLALIAAITAVPVDPVDTASAARAEPFAPLVLERDQLRAVVPRTVGEALLAAPSAALVRRHHVAGDDLLLRGRGGARPRIRLDGLSLDHALTRYDDRPELSLVDPWMLESLAITDRDQVELHTLRPRAGLHTWAALMGRSADRSSGVGAVVDGALGPVGLLLAGRYDDHGTLRTDAEHTPAPWPYHRAGLHARAQVLGRAGDPISVVLGADLDRLTSVIDRVGRDRMRLRRALSLDARASSADFVAELQAGLADHALERQEGARLREESVQALEARARAAYRLGPLTVGAVGVVQVSGAEVSGARAADGRTRALEGGLELGLSLVHVEAEARVGVADARTTVGARDTEGSGLVTDGRITVRPTDAWAVMAAWRYDLRLPTVGDVLAFGPALSLPERALLVEAGPSVVLGAWEVGLVGYGRWIERGLEPLLGGAASYVEGALIGGVESRVRWQPRPELILSAAGGWTGADRVLAGVPGLVVAGSARWEDGWFVEVAGRGLVPTEQTSPGETPPPGTLSVVDRREWAGALISLRGAVPVGAGFVLGLCLDNALDVRTRGFGGAANDPGVDLRAVLSHAW